MRAKASRGREGGRGGTNRRREKAGGRGRERWRSRGR